MKLHELKPAPKSRKAKKRVGRGNGSGLGTYCGKGMNGQTARAGGRRRPGFEGGQTPLYMRMPKLGGFKNPCRKEYLPVNVSVLNDNFKANETVSLETLAAKRIIRSTKRPVKILGVGELKIALTIQVDKVSKTAAEKITKAGGKIEQPGSKAEA
ncbi:50S ribosomal protein L15 [Candidatus Peregrinibacteria bacterium]|jgi:large subunit ribosomal protein L15|nr:50S ribosomal protein L15 [Candidatus Peregrinibacteria bacterium]MBT7484440.1 50S ribosomal protein L15 [Candidatus Peregrinibacteria bacterium]MBT7703705.1 50S ribosomal protein L15 [Candidatus Peregrinibacteria bacterium]